MKKWVLCFVFTFNLSSLLHATDLIDVYQQALESDTTFKQAYSNYMSNSEALPQALAALLPQLTLAALTGPNNTIVDAPGFTINSKYTSRQWQANASQAVFNYQAWAQVQQAKASVKAAQANFNNAAQELILRTASAYLQVLFAQDTLNFAEAKKRANKRQFEQAEARFKVGLEAITAVYEAKAGYDQSVAGVISAKNNQINQNEHLRQLTNHVYEYLSPLRDGTIPLIHPEPNNIDEWVNTGLKQNYKLYAAKYGLQAARENVQSQTAGNWPVFALQGNTKTVENTTGTTTGNVKTPLGTVNNATALSSIFIPTRQSNSNLSLAMNFPIFQGGLVASKTRQAQFDFQTSSEQLEQVYRDIVVNSRTTFNSIIDGISKIKADKQTVISRKRSLESTSAQFDVGTRTMVDVVNAQEKLFESQEELAQDQYELINNILNLKYLAGTLNVNDLEEINSWLATTRIGRATPTKLSHF